VLVCVDHNADFLEHGLGVQSIAQTLAVAGTLAASIVTGYFTGMFVLGNPDSFAGVPDYEDAVWWVEE
jgi:hypothetical protein